MFGRLKFYIILTLFSSMKLQKHQTKKGTDYFKWEIIIPKDAVKIAKFKENDELKAESKEGEIKLIKIKYPKK